jgi:sugar lactone lactonase YvrE
MNRYGFLHRGVIVIALIAGSLACGGVGAATETPKPSDTPAPAATKTPIPLPTATPTPESHAITAENAGELKEVETISTNAAGSWISAVAFDPTKQEVATFGYDKMVRIWDAETGALVRQMGPHGNWGLGLAYSPDGALLASGGGGADIVIWDPSSGQKRGNAISSGRLVYDLAWSRDGQHFATADERSSRLAIFSSSGSLEQEIPTGSGWLWSVAFSSKYLAVGNDTTLNIHVYDADGFGAVTQLSYPAVAGALDFSPDGSLLASCHRDGMINIWDTSSWALVKSWMAHPKKGYAMGCKAGAFSLNGDVYFSGGDEGALHAWDPQTGALLNSFEFGVMVWSMSMSGDGEMLAAGLDNGTLHILGLPKD